MSLYIMKITKAIKLRWLCLIDVKINKDLDKQDEHIDACVSKHCTWESDQRFSSLGVLPAVVIQYCHCKAKPAESVPVKVGLHSTLHGSAVVISNPTTSSSPTVPLLHGRGNWATAVPSAGHRPVTHWAAQSQRHCQLFAFTNWHFFVLPSLTPPQNQDLVASAALH